MRHGVTRDEAPRAPIPDLGREAAMRRADRVLAMAMKGDVAERVATAARNLLASWREEDIPRGDLRRRIEALQSIIDEAMPSIEDYVLDAEGPAAKRQAECQLAAAVALADVIDGELEEMRYLL